MTKNKRWLDSKYRTEQRIKWTQKHKINYMMPTICPAPKSANIIEDVCKGIELYAPYTDKVILQTKFMGSYCNIYLHKNLSETYFVSRNGYKIDHVDNEVLQKSLEKIHNEIFTNNLLCINHSDLQMVILEAELMPWRTLGGGLIDKEYTNYYQLHKTHCDYLEKSDLYEKIDKVTKSSEFIEFKKDYNADPDNIKSKYKAHIVRQYREIINIHLPELDKYKSAIDLFKTQLDLYGVEKEPYFEIFNVLKYVYTNSEVLNHTNEVYTMFNDDYIIIDTKDPDYKLATDFVAKHERLGFEGVMIKPLETRLINIPPALKVRNNNYLQLIYGVNFNDNLEYYIGKRNIRSKMRQSIRGYEHSLKLLDIKYSDLKENNQYYKNILYKVIDAEQYLKNLDTRL